MSHLRSLYVSENLTAIWHGPQECQGAARIVTFEPVGGASSMAQQGKFFAWPVVQNHRVPVIHIVPSQAYWYQEPDMAACLDAVRPHLSCDAFTYGSSMGGYAVARFTDALGLSRGLALSPRWSVDPAVAPWAKAPNRATDHITFRYDRARGPRRARLWQLTDQTIAAEAQHAHPIAREGPTDTLDVPGAGHPVGPALMECKLIHHLIATFLQGCEDPVDFQARIHERLPQTSFALMRQADRIEGASKLKTLAKALERNPVNPVLRRRCARLFDALGKTRAAAAMRAKPPRHDDLPILRALLLNET